MLTFPFLNIFRYEFFIRFDEKIYISRNLKKLPYFRFTLKMKSIFIDENANLHKKL